MGTGASAQWLSTATVQTEHSNVIKWTEEFEKKKDYQILRPHAIFYVLGVYSLPVVEAIENKYGACVTSLDLMKLLRTEIMSGSDKGRSIYNRIRRGHILPVSVNLAILAQEVQRMSSVNPAQVFLVHLVGSFPKSTFGLNLLLERFVPRVSQLLFTKMPTKSAQEILAKRYPLCVAKFSANMYDTLAQTLDKTAMSVSCVDCGAADSKAVVARSLAIFERFVDQARIACDCDPAAADSKSEGSADEKSDVDDKEMLSK